jgi:hypothetical protein
MNLGRFEGLHATLVKICPKAGLYRPAKRDSGEPRQQRKQDARLKIALNRNIAQFFVQFVRSNRKNMRYNGS